MDSHYENLSDVDMFNGVDERLDGFQWDRFFDPFFDDLYRVLRHEVRNPRGILSGHLELAREGAENSWAREIEGQEPELEEFLELAESVEERTKELGIIPREELDSLAEFESYFPGQTGERVNEMIEIARDAGEYQDYVFTGKPDRVELGDVLEPLEESIEQKVGADRLDAHTSYNGYEDEEVHGNRALRLVSHTLSKNWKEHGNSVEEPEMWFDVNDLGDRYEINIWDNGKSLYEDEEGLNPEEREELAEQIFDKDEGHQSGFGLYMSREITETFGGEITYSEDCHEEQEGFGYRWVLQKPGQYSTSESL